MKHIFIKLLLGFSTLLIINSCGGGGGGGETPAETGGTNTGKTGTETPDTTLPLITMIGSDETVEAGSSYSDKGATAQDNIDGNITAKIVTDNPVDTSIVSLYRVKYNVKDTANNAGIEVIRKVSVVDVTAPVLTMIGSNETIEAGTTYTDKGATALDKFDGDITSKIVTTNTINTANISTQNVIYNVKDANDNSATPLTRVITITDNTTPKITLNGDAVLKIALNSTYKEQNATVTDNASGTISPVISGTVDTSKYGLTTLTYTATDSQNNSASITRKIYVTSLLKTGQSIVYQTGDDGTHQAGVEGNFTRNNTQNTVTDHIRNLVWEDNATSPINASWATQKAYCDNLSLASQSDWRMPTITEVASLLSYNEHNISSAFNNKGTGKSYITSTPAVDTNASYFYIKFSNTEKISGTIPKNAPSFTVKCVRGSTINEHNVSKDSNNILSDNMTTLRWQDNYSDNGDNTKSSSWSDALNYCKALTLGGITWRLPNINELQSFLKEYKLDTTKDEAEQIFENVDTNFYFSSSTYKDDNTSAYALDFGTGILSTKAKTASHNVVCVSDFD